MLILGPPPRERAGLAGAIRSHVQVVPRTDPDVKVGPASDHLAESGGFVHKVPLRNAEARA